MKIEITSAKNNYQSATIDGIDYEFSFTQRDLTDSIQANNSTSNLETLTGLDSDDYNAFEMAEILSEDWLDEDVSVMIADYIKENEGILVDHLISA